MVTSLLNRAKLSLLSPRLDATWRCMGKVCILIKLCFMIYLTFCAYFKKKRLWKRFFFILPVQLIASLSPDSPSEALRISWWAPRGLCGRLWWNPLQQREARPTDGVLNQILATSQLPAADAVFSHVINRNSRPWTHSFLQSLRLASLPWVCPAGYALRRQKTWTHIVRKE